MLDPEDIEGRDFLVSLRGYDRAEVRSFLADVAAQVRDLRTRLETAEATARDAQAAPAADADPAQSEPSRLFAEIGEETRRILEAAQEAAQDMTRNARVDADREVQAARHKVARLLAEGERRREDIEEVVAGLEAARVSLTTNLLEVGRTIEQIVEELGAPAPPATTVREALTAEAAAIAVQEPDVEDVPEQDAVADELEQAGDGAGELLHEDAATREADPSPVAVADVDQVESAEPEVLRGRALSSLHPELVRRVKRGLQDVQNIVLDRLRRSGGEGVPESLLPADEEVEGLGALAGDTLTRAYGAGVAAAGRLAGRPLDEPEKTRDLIERFCNDAGERVRSPLAATLRMGRSADEGLPALADRVGAVFAELKATVAEELAATHLAGSYELGLLDTWAAGGITHRRWVLGKEPRCPEGRCRHNDQVGVVPVGETYPSGHETPPIHVGCTCTTIPVPESSS